MDAGAARTLRAAAEVFVPSDETFGAADIEADRFIAHYLDFVMPGLAELIPSILDEATGGSFADAEPAERARVLATFDEHPEPMLRDLPRLLALLTLGAVYGAWSGQDEAGELVRDVLGWRATGFDGPSRGRSLG